MQFVRVTYKASYQFSSIQIELSNAYT